MAMTLDPVGLYVEIYSCKKIDILKYKLKRIFNPARHGLWLSAMRNRRFVYPGRLYEAF